MYVHASKVCSYIAIGQSKEIGRQHKYPKSKIQDQSQGSKKFLGPWTEDPMSQAVGSWILGHQRIKTFDLGSIAFVKCGLQILDLRFE